MQKSADLWRPGSVKIKRYYAKNGRLIPTAKRGKENSSEIETSTMSLPDISARNIGQIYCTCFVLISLLFISFPPLRRGDQSTVFSMDSIY